MEINYSKFKTQPRCKYCNNKLVDDITWRKYQLKKNFVGDRFALKDYELYGKIYNREICEACLLKNKDITSQKIWVNDNIKNNKIIERKFILFVVWESYLKIDSFTEYFYNSTLKGYINERKNS